MKQLPLLELAYNSSMHSSTKVTPFSANYGYQPKLPVSFLCAPDAAPAVIVTAFCRKIQEATKRIWEIVKQASAQASASTERRENARRGNPQYRVGDEVLC